TDRYGRTEVTHYDKSVDPDAAALTAWMCSLAPASGTDLWRADRARIRPDERPTARITTTTNESFVEETNLVWDREAPGSDVPLPLLLAQRAAAADPGNYVYARALGAALYRAGKLEAAVRQLERALTLQEQAPSVWLFLAMSHHRLKQEEE